MTSLVMRIETQRLIIDEVQERNAALIEELRAVFNSNQEFHRAAGDQLVWEAGDIESYLEGERNHPEMPKLESRQFVIRERAGGEAVGTAQLIAPRPALEEPVHWISLLMIRADRQRRGYGGEAVAAIEEALFLAGWNEVRVFVHRETHQARAFWLERGYAVVDSETHNHSGAPGAVLRKAWL